MGFGEARGKQLPPWIGDAVGLSYELAIGSDEQNIVDGMKGGIDARWPAFGPDDALELQGRDRIILRAPSETNDAFRARIGDPFGLNYWIGTSQAVIDIFAPYGLNASTVGVFNNVDISWPDGADWFSRFFVLVDVTAANLLSGSPFKADGLWSDPGNWDDGGLWDTTLSAQDASYLRRSIVKRKAPASYPVAIAFSDLNAGDGLWGSPGTYDDGGNWDDTAGGVFYLPIGHVWGEESWLGGTDNWDDPGNWEAFET